MNLKLPIGQVRRFTSVASLKRSEAIKVFEEFAQSEFEVLRLKAIQAIRDLGAKECAGILQKSLDDEDEDIRIDAVDAIERIGNKEAIPKLIEHLIHDPCGEVKAACVKVLAELEAYQAIPILRELVTDRGEKIEWDENEFHLDGWDSWLDVQIESIKALAKLKDEESIESICRAVRDPEGQDIDTVAFDALAKIGKKSLEQLAEFAESDTRHRRYCAVRAISKIDDVSTDKYLLAATDDQDSSIRSLAFDALLEKNTDHKLIERALLDSSEDVRLKALARININDGNTIARILNDPSSKLHLALINKIDASIPRDDVDDITFKILDLLSKSDDVEVASIAFGVLAASYTEIINDKLKELFSEADEFSEDTERRQWAVVDKFELSNHPLAVDWLQKACESQFRAVRLKAIAVLGSKLGESEASSEKRSGILEFLVNIAKLCNQSINDSETDSEKSNENIVGNEEAKSADELEIDQNDGPTSSLSAILGSDSQARQVMEESSAKLAESQLSTQEREMLEKTKQIPSKKKILLGQDENDTEVDSARLAIQLIGEQEGTQKELIELAENGNKDLMEVTLSSLNSSFQKFGVSIEMAKLTEIIKSGLGSDNSKVKLQAIQLISFAGKQNEDCRKILIENLKSDDSLIRAKTLEVLCCMDCNAETAIEFIRDPSPVVRQQAIRLMAKFSPELAKENFVDFLIENPDFAMSEFFAKNLEDFESIGRKLVNCLKDSTSKSVWPTILTAISFVVKSKFENSV